MRKELKAVIKEAIGQGWRVEIRKSSAVLYSPDGVTIVTAHFTPSDHHAWGNFIGKMRNGGFIWPPRGR